MFLVGSPVKKCVALQANDAAVSLGQVVFVSKVQLFYLQITEQTGSGRGEGATPLACYVS